MDPRLQYMRQQQMQQNIINKQQLLPQQQNHPNLLQKQQVRRNLLFYSNKCPTSNNLIKMMEREDLLKYFEMVCIDGRENKLPPVITMVPALITTDTPRPWMGADAFKWLQNIKYMRYQQLQDKNNKSQLYNTIKTLEEGGPKAFTDEMTGISDNFAYKDIDNAQPKAFEEYGKEATKDTIIYTPPIEKNRINNNQQSKLINEYSHERKIQDTELDKTLRLKQLDEIIRVENEKIMQAKNAGLL
jgi:hypothetical protein